MKIVVDDANLAPHRERLEAAVDAQVCWYVGGAPLEELRDADVYVGSRFTAEMAEVAEKLWLIHVAGAGTDKVEFDALAPAVLVANTFHHERSIAEYVVAAAVMLRRGFLAQDRELRQGVWSTSVHDASIPQAGTLGEARVGFVGFGHIGRCAWKVFRTFGCRASAVTGSGRVPSCGLEWTGDTTELDRLLAECDVAVVSAPLNEHTEGMIGMKQLRALGSDGVLINVWAGSAGAGAGAVRRVGGRRDPRSGDRCLVSLPGGRRRQRTERAAVRRVAECVDDAALVGRHAGYVHRSRRRHRGEHRAVAARRAAAERGARRDVARRTFLTAR